MMLLKRRLPSGLSLSAVLVGAALAVSVDPLAAQDRSGEAILLEAEKRFAQVHDFTAVLDIVADIERLSVPPMRAVMYFKQPDKVHFETEGTAILPKEGVMLSIIRLTSKFAVQSTGREELNGRQCYKLLLRPKGENTAEHTVIVLIDSSRWTPERIVSSLPDRRVVTASFEHTLTDGYWMPSMLTVSVAAHAADTTDTSPLEQELSMPRRQAPRKGTVTIRYSDYRINTGLDDALFEKAVGTAK